MDQKKGECHSFIPMITKSILNTLITKGNNAAKFFENKHN